MSIDESRYEIRVPKALKDTYLKTAKSLDRDGAQLIRDFMREFIKQHAQPDLIEPLRPKRRTTKKG